MSHSRSQRHRRAYFPSGSPSQARARCRRSSAAQLPGLRVAGTEPAVVSRSLYDFGGQPAPPATKAGRGCVLLTFPQRGCPGPLEATCRGPATRQPREADRRRHRPDCSYRLWPSSSTGRPTGRRHENEERRLHQTSNSQSQLGYPGQISSYTLCTACFCLCTSRVKTKKDGNQCDAYCQNGTTKYMRLRSLARGRRAILRYINGVKLALVSVYIIHNRCWSCTNAVLTAPQGIGHDHARARRISAEPVI